MTTCDSRLPCVVLLIVFLICLPSIAQDEVAPVEDAVELSPVELLKSGLDSEGADKRMAAIDALADSDLDAAQRAAVIDLLLKALDDEVPDIRAFAAEMIGQFGDEAKHAIPRLLEQAGDQGMTVELKGVWVSVSKALSAIGPAALQPMLDAIPESDRITYYAITGAIGESGDQAKSAAPVLIERLRNGPENRRWATMFALSKLGEAAAPAIPDLIKQLDHENFNMQVIACRALAVHGPAAKPAVPKLLQLIDDGILSARTHAAMCLGAIGPIEGVDSVGILSKMAQEKNAFSQERAMIALGRLGSVARPAIALINELIEEEDFSPKPEAAKALWLVTGESERSLAVLTELIDSLTYDFRVMAVLTEMGPAAQSAAALVARKLADEDQGVRLLAVQTLGAMGPGAAPHLEALRRHLEDSDRDVVAAIHDAIAKIIEQ